MSCVFTWVLLRSTLLQLILLNIIINESLDILIIDVLHFCTLLLRKYIHNIHMSKYCNYNLLRFFLHRFFLSLYKIQDTRYKIFYFRHEAHSYNTIYIHVNNKIQCIIYNDKKYYINFSKI